MTKTVTSTLMDLVADLRNRCDRAKIALKYADAESRDACVVEVKALELAIATLTAKAQEVA